MLNKLRDEIHQNAIDHGFYDTDEDRQILVKLMLIVSELGEACEAYREGRTSDLPLFHRQKTLAKDSNLNPNIIFNMDKRNPLLQVGV